MKSNLISKSLKRIFKVLKEYSKICFVHNLMLGDSIKNSKSKLFEKGFWRKKYKNPDQDLTLG